MYSGMYILATELSPVKSRSNTRTNLDVVASIIYTTAYRPAAAW